MDSSKETEEQEEKGLIQEFLGEVFNFDHGIPATIILMIKNPKAVIEGYFTPAKDYVNPFRYTIFILAITTLISSYFIDYEKMFQQTMEAGTGASMEEMIAVYNEMIPSVDWAKYFENVQQMMVNLTVKFNQLLYIFILAPILALMGKWFFKKHQPRFKNHYVLYLYSLATYSVFSLFITPLYKWIDFGWVAILTNITMIGYCMYVQGSYLEFKKGSKYILSFFSILIAMVVFNIAVALITYVGAFIMTMTG